MMRFKKSGHVSVVGWRAFIENMNKCERNQHTEPLLYGSNSSVSKTIAILSDLVAWCWLERLLEYVTFVVVVGDDEGAGDDDGVKGRYSLLS